MNPGQRGYMNYLERLRLKDQEEATRALESRDTAVLSFDGGIEKNPGPACVWAWVMTAAHGFVLDSDHGRYEMPEGGVLTVNMAEYAALINGLETVEAADFRTLLVKGDSQLVIRQMQGHYVVQAPTLLPLFARARTAANRMVKDGRQVLFEWVPRSENEQADALGRS